jgi:hypothetical protein
MLDSGSVGVMCWYLGGNRHFLGENQIFYTENCKNWQKIGKNQPNLIWSTPTKFNLAVQQPNFIGHWGSPQKNPVFSLFSLQIWIYILENRN